jgi:putative transposase
VRNRFLATSMRDAGWAQFRTIRDAKAACAGRQVITVPAGVHQPGLEWRIARWEPLSGSGSRKACRCARDVPTSHVCPLCGLVLDRDENAAKTMLRAGRARQARTWPGGASVV